MIFEVIWNRLTSDFKPKHQLHGNRHASPAQRTSLDNLIVITYLPYTGFDEKSSCKKIEFMVIDQYASDVDNRGISGFLWPVWN